MSNDNEMNVSSSEKLNENVDINSCLKVLFLLFVLEKYDIEHMELFVSK